MLNKPITAADDRRNIVTIIHPRALIDRHAPDLVQRRILERRLAAFLFTRARRITLLNSPLFIINAFPIITLALVSLIFFGLLPCVGWIGVMVAVPTAIRWYLRDAGPAQWARQLAASIAAEGICPACAYSIERIPPDPDGCIACPECNAAWRADRIVAPTSNLERPTLPENAANLLCLLRFIPIPARRLDHDAAGRIVPLIDARLRDLPNTEADISPDTRTRIVQSILARYRWRRLLGAMAISAAITCLWSILLMVAGARPHEFTHHSTLTFALAIPLTLAALYAITAILIGTLLIPRRAIVPAMLASHRCPVCAGNLSIEHMSANTLACPTCASRWTPTTAASSD